MQEEKKKGEDESFVTSKHLSLSFLVTHVAHASLHFHLFPSLLIFLFQSAITETFIFPISPFSTYRHSRRLQSLSLHSCRSILTSYSSNRLEKREREAAPYWSEWNTGLSKGRDPVSFTTRPHAAIAAADIRFLSFAVAFRPMQGKEEIAPTSSFVAWTCWCTEHQREIVRVKVPNGAW